uniref:Uncharacterized protein n=1 Tax=Tanacetum cinerariifolium TaxID=118510 RepID=A0A6L2K380_TANCI|nr:hypothetical protein [Tanacetum cinerariifolium]
MGHGSAHGSAHCSAPVNDDEEDDSHVEEVSPVKPKKPSRHTARAKKNDPNEPLKEWTMEEEIVLCQAWCDVSENNVVGYRYGVSVEMDTTYRAVCLECGQRLAIFTLCCKVYTWIRHTTYSSKLGNGLLVRQVLDTAYKSRIIQRICYQFEYLRELWYSTKVDVATNTITFTLSCSTKPLSFDLGDFLTIIGLKYSENYEASPPKKTVRAGLATLGRVDKKNPQLTSSELINLSPLRIRYFSPIWKVLMHHIVKCLGVARLSSTEPGKTLLLSSREVNTCSTIDKSLSRINMQSATQSKAPTDKRSKKKKIPSSFEPKTSTFVRRSKPKKTVAETQRAEEPMATTDTTKGLDASESTEEEHETKVDENIEDLLATDSGICSLGNVDLDQVMKEQKDDDAEITFMGTVTNDQIMEEAKSDVESMPDDETLSISRDDDEEYDDFDNDFLVDDKVKNVRQGNHFSVKQRVRNVINDEMPAMLKTLVLKPLNKEFNAMNKLDFDRFMALDQSIHKFIYKNIRDKFDEVAGLLWHLTKKLDKTLDDMNELVGLVSHVVNLMDATTPLANATAEGEKESQSQPDNIINDTQIPEVPALA